MSFPACGTTFFLFGYLFQPLYEGIGLVLFYLLLSYLTVVSWRSALFWGEKGGSGSEGEGEVELGSRSEGRGNCGWNVWEKSLFSTTTTTTESARPKHPSYSENMRSEVFDQKQQCDILRISSISKVSREAMLKSHISYYPILLCFLAQRRNN